ncbi:uncharacterized protein LOC110650682 isoform X2 [Hevea brasiliensis]|uniref:uncharacterized protein LOC110650682 isoform X2 n=1 Tax=Hevea brasiliensis TaxID=3981 RepID=UPI0025E32A30|nr:uncharacterized protein LOC110650682 isoform X2 [Hevea brasiliensis]XP_058000783.1 uncharacterized protein LOC110650682 isoform X2 [Hevea brasiliensis]
MSNKEGQDFYSSLSRKELQSLCKKFGLPARKSSFEMGKSLFSFFQKNDLSLTSLGKTGGGIQEVLLPSSSVTTWHAEAPFNLTGNMIKDSFQQRSCPREGNGGNISTKSKELESRTGLGAHDKEDFGGAIDYFPGPSQPQFVSRSAGGGVIHKETPSSFSGRMEHTPQFHCGHINVGVCPIENASPKIRTYTKVPASFEFHVSSEEGIKLCVDLNSSPSDWIKKYKNQVSLTMNVDSTKSRSIHQELGCIRESDNTQIKSSFPQNVNPDEIEDGRGQGKPSPSLVMENNIGIDHPDGGNKSSAILLTRPCSVEGSDCLGEDQGPISSKPRSNVQNQIISNIESFTKNGDSTILDSDIIDTPTEKTACNFAVNTISDGSVDLIAIEHQNSKRDDEVCENSTRQNNSDLENNCVVFPGFLASSSAEMQLSEAGNYHKDTSCSPNKNGELLDLDDSKHNIVNEQAALATSSENDQCGNHSPTCSEERRTTINGKPGGFVTSHCCYEGHKKN